MYLRGAANEAVQSMGRCGGMRTVTTRIGLVLVCALVGLRYCCEAYAQLLRIDNGVLLTDRSSVRTALVPVRI